MSGRREVFLSRLVPRRHAVTARTLRGHGHASRPPGGSGSAGTVSARWEQRGVHEPTEMGASRSSMPSDAGLSGSDPEDRVLPIEVGASGPGCLTRTGDLRISTGAAGVPSGSLTYSPPLYH